MKPLEREIVSFQNEKDWLEGRKQFISGTELAAVVGLNEYLSPSQLYEQRNSPYVPIINDAVRRGRIMEPAVVEAVKLEMPGKQFRDLKIYEQKTVYRNPLIRLSSTPDSYLGSNIADLDAVIECKSANINKFRHWALNGPPNNYLLQVHAQILTANPKKAYIAILGLSNQMPLLVYQIHPRPALKGLLGAEISRFLKAESEGKRIRAAKTTKDKVISIISESYELVYCSHREEFIELANVEIPEPISIEQFIRG